VGDRREVEKGPASSTTVESRPQEEHPGPCRRHLESSKRPPRLGKNVK